MAKRFKKRSRRRRIGKAFRRHAPKKVPFEMLVAAGSIPFTPARNGWSNPMNALSTGNYEDFGNHMKMGFIGMEPGGHIDLIKTINPFDLESGRYVKMLIYAGLIGKIRHKIAPQTSQMVSKIPLIGRWVS